MFLLSLSFLLVLSPSRLVESFSPSLDSTDCPRTELVALVLVSACFDSLGISFVLVLVERTGELSDQVLASTNNLH